ncbi:Hint domain-containing protein [Rhodalgimonas zhirmunskyi]|uniref:Hint domain-containing protein n=1 Tax=Rhodalgimonas zhirmunskyi TaxID=2964767 RepID=A0AAJ1UEB2_9RHOB|nr:Hint domain-containing protein [Rhodoalgimonas zhirmunskyi]MDQ2094487.1 Hint domain-containing protein [Rhodoalgimonas zhirmunskyi]
MAFTIYAENNEFAASTGSNVNSEPGKSDFDYPPTSSKDLEITTHDGDDEPRLFEVGDIYDVTFGGNGGATILNAVVVRSDSAESGGVIVFEGEDLNGDLTQVIWTPGFDLESWYFDNFANGQAPNYYTTDQDAAYTHGYVCFEESTRISTAMGGVAVREFWQGDLVDTLDAGPQPVMRAVRRVVAGYGANTPVLFSPGAIGNFAPLRLSPQHRVMIRSPMAELMFGTSEVLVPAKALVNGRDILYAPCPRVAYVHLLLAEHAILFAEGALCESLLAGDEAIAREDLPPGLSERPARLCLRYGEALALATQPCERGAREVPQPAAQDATVPAL